MIKFIGLLLILIISTSVDVSAQNNQPISDQSPGNGAQVDSTKNLPRRAEIQISEQNTGNDRQERIQVREESPGQKIDQDMYLEVNTGSVNQRSDNKINGSGNSNQEVIPGKMNNLGANATPPGLMNGFTMMEAEQRQEIIRERLQDIQNLNDEKLQQRAQAIAQRQEQIQEKVANASNKLTNRNHFMKLLFGADEKAVEELTAQLEAYQSEIAELQQILQEAENPADREAIAYAIDTLQAERGTIAKNIIMAQDGISLFGWLRRLF